MEYLISNTVKAGELAGFAARRDGSWLILSHADLKNPLGRDTTTFHEIEPDFFSATQPAFAKALMESPDAELFVDPETKQVNVNTNHKHAGFYDYSARASHQVNLKVGWWQIIKGKDGFLTKMILLAAVTLLLCYYISWLFLFYWLRILAMNVIKMQSAHNIMLSGSLDPGIVISELPLRVAVKMDLSKYGAGNYPLIRVVDTMLPEKYIREGCRIPVAGGYQDIDAEDHKPYWDFYEPTLLANYTDVSTNSRKAYEIPQYQWDEIYETVKDLPRVPDVGFYTIRSLENNWDKEEELRFYDSEARIYGDNGESLGKLK